MKTSRTFSESMDDLEHFPESLKFNFQRLEDELEKQKQEKENKLLPSDCFCDICGCCKDIFDICMTCGY